jgi:hypothetical protein
MIILALQALSFSVFGDSAILSRIKRPLSKETLMAYQGQPHDLGTNSHSGSC